MKMPLHLESVAELTEAEREDIRFTFLECRDAAEAIADVRMDYPHADVEEIRVLMLGVAEMEEQEVESGRHDEDMRELYREHAALLRQAAADLDG